MRESRRGLGRPLTTDQRGVSLVEVLVVIAVIIPVILAATLGLLTSARLATSTKTSQELNAAAASFAESLKDVAYVDCASPSDYDGATGLWEPPVDRADDRRPPRCDLLESGDEHLRDDLSVP